MIGERDRPRQVTSTDKPNATCDSTNNNNSKNKLPLIATLLANGATLSDMSVRQDPLKPQMRQQLPQPVLSCLRKFVKLKLSLNALNAKPSEPLNGLRQTLKSAKNKRKLPLGPSHAEPARNNNGLTATSQIKLEILNEPQSVSPKTNSAKTDELTFKTAPSNNVLSAKPTN